MRTFMEPKSKLPELKALFEKARQQYYNEDHTDLTDSEFDALEDRIRELDPEWKPLTKTGVRTFDHKNEVELERYMPSLDKKYPEHVEAHVRRVDARSWLVMDKLDGTSLQLIYDGGIPVRLITRGDGIVGRDVSFMLKALVAYNRIPKTIPRKRRTIFRCEGVMTKAVFERCWSKAAVNDRGADNARQCVNGAFLRKKPTRVLADISMMVLGMYGESLKSGLMDAENWGFHVVPYFDHVVISKLSKMLALRKKDSAFQIDGLVFGSSDFVLDYKTADKPKLLAAYKENADEQAVQTEVVSIDWKTTRLNRWQPRIFIEPTEMDGVVVRKATAHNPQWMIEKGIGPGAIVKVLRSGGVIPKIVGVVKQAPFVGPPGKYVQRGRFFYAPETVDSAIRGTRFFLTTLGIELLAEKTLGKLYEVGFETATNFIWIISHREQAHKLFRAAGLGEVQTKKALDELERVLSNTISLKTLMVASGCFEAGVGERRLSQLEAAGLSMRKICNHKNEEALIATLLEVKGFKEKTATLIAEGVMEFRDWYKDHAKTLQVNGNLPTKKGPVHGPLNGLIISFTGYRSAEQEAWVVANGGTVADFSAKTDVLLYSEKGKASTKVAKAGSKAKTFADLQSLTSTGTGL